MAVNVPSRSPHFLLLGARMPAPGNPVPAVGAYPGGGPGQEAIAQANARQKGRSGQGPLSDEVKGCEVTQTL